MIINDQELEGFCRDRYFARALRLTTKEKGWWKTPILLLLACFVPIVGPLGAIGYVLEWMRSIAWGNNTGLQGSVNCKRLASVCHRSCVSCGIRSGNFYCIFDSGA